MIRGPASHPQLLGNSSEQGTLSWMRTRNCASTAAKSSSLNWIPWIDASSKHDPQVMLIFFLTTSSCCQWQLQILSVQSFQMFPCQRMSFWPSARIWQVSEAMSANMRTIIEPMVTGSARSRLGSVEHFTISLESRYQNQHAHSTGF